MDDIMNYKKLMQEEWTKVYKKRKKISGSKKAKISANAYVKSKLVESFLTEGEKEKNKKDKYKTYYYEDNEVILTTDKKALDKFDAEKKGVIKDLKDDHYLDIIRGVEEIYKINLTPYLYYIINGE
jgi:hypothetical protein